MSGWLLLIAGILAAWAYDAHRIRRRLQQYQGEIRRLKASSGGLEMTLASSAGRLDALLSAVNEAVMRLDRQGRVLAANARAREIFAIPDDVAFPVSLMMYFRDPDWHEELERGLQLMPERVLLPNMTLGNRVLAPRLAQLGREQALLLCMDVSEQYRLERQRRTFLSNLMHDLKTPLTSLLGYARSLQSFGEDPGFREEAAQVIADEARHVNHLLDSLLTLDQIEFAERNADASCDAAAVLRSVCDVLRPRLEAQGGRIRRHCCEHLPHVAMSADDVERVLGNLIENAIRYAPGGGGIDVRLEHAGGLALISVEDRGPGVPEKELPRLTERFYRVDKARARRKGGHGLGLAIVKELVDMHGGELSLENVEPHGLKVVIRLPLKSDPGNDRAGLSQN